MLERVLGKLGFQNPQAAKGNLEELVAARFLIKQFQAGVGDETALSVALHRQDFPKAANLINTPVQVMKAALDRWDDEGGAVHQSRQR